MRWKLLRRRLSISAPRMIVRSHLPWPLRWAVGALALGFSGALALWAFDVGRGLAGLDHGLRADVRQLTDETARLRAERDKAQSIVNTAESLLTTERTTREMLAQQVKTLEAENLALKGDLGFFERLLPAGGAGKLAVRGLQAEVVGAGQLRFQLLVMQDGKSPPEFSGRYDVTLRGELDGRAWTQPLRSGSRNLQFKQYQRIDGMLEFPVPAVVQGLQVRVVDAQGSVRASQDITL